MTCVAATETAVEVRDLSKTFRTGWPRRRLQPALRGVSFVVPPTNQGTVLNGSTTVFIDGKPAARLGDTVMDCNDPVPAPTGTIVGGSTTVMIG